MGKTNWIVKTKAFQQLSAEHQAQGNRGLSSGFKDINLVFLRGYI